MLENLWSNQTQKKTKICAASYQWKPSTPTCSCQYFIIVRYLCLYIAKGSSWYEVFKYVIKYLKALRCNIGKLCCEGLRLYIRKRNPCGPTVCTTRYSISNVLSYQVPVNQLRADIFSCEQSFKLDWNKAASSPEPTRPAHAPAVRGIAQQIWKIKSNFFRAQNHKHCLPRRAFKSAPL